MAIAPQENQDYQKEERSAVRRFVGRLMGSSDVVELPQPEPPEPGSQMPEGLSEFEQMDWKLMHDFSADVASLAIADVAIPLPDRPLPHNLSEFSLTAIVPNRKLPMSKNEARSKPTMGTGHQTIPRTKVAITKAGSGMYVDSSLAIGLAYKGEVCAIASAFLTSERRLRIIQVQGIRSMWTGEGKPKREQYKDNGLHAGLLWRDTLVKAWLGVAKIEGISEIEIQGAANNKYWDHPLKSRLGGEETNDRHNARLRNSYDAVASRLEFWKDTVSGNWLKRI